MEAMYERIAEVKSEKRRALLLEHEESARLSKRLATMVCDVPVGEDVDELVCQGGYELPVESIEAFFRTYEFTTLIRRLHEMAAGAGEAAQAAPPAPEPELRLVEEAGAGALAATLEQREAALALAGDGGATAAAVTGDGELVQTAAVRGDDLAGLWRLAAHVVVHDAKAQPGFAAAAAGPAFDTAIAAYLLAPERPEKERTLEALAGVAEGDGKPAGGEEAPSPPFEAARRAARTYRVAAAQRPRLLELGLERLYRETELPLVRVLARMEAAGVKIDPYRLGEITARVRDRADELADRIHELAGGPFTIGSTQQLAEVLFSRLGLEPLRKGKTGYSTDARVLRALRDAHPIVPAIEEWRELTKLLNTYLDPLPQRIDPATGRVHTTFSQTVASTGRLSSTNPNLQNIPIRTELGAEIRACFVAEEGARLVVADYSQIELRLMASFSQEPALIEAYHRGEDVHRVTAAAVAGIPVEEVTRQQRDRAKATNFGIMYGLSAFGLSEQVDIPQDEARAFIEAYFAKYPRVKEFRERVIAQATQDGYVTTLYGRRRAVPELRSSRYNERSLGERLAVNTILQGTRRRHHQDGDGAHGPRARGAAPRRPARPAGARRARRRGARGRGRGRQAAHARRHVRGLRHRSADGGRDRQRGRLAERQVDCRECGGASRRGRQKWLHLALSGRAPVLYFVGSRPGRGSRAVAPVNDGPLRPREAYHTDGRQPNDRHPGRHHRRG